jgi:hypothetical protein
VDVSASRIPRSLSRTAMPLLIRCALVLAGLVVAGVTLGALAAGAALATTYALSGRGWDSYHYFDDVVAAAWVGGALGLLVGPACGLAFLRHVPLWRALLGPTLAAYAGGVLGDRFGSGILGALVAVQLVVLWLNRSGGQRGPHAGAAPAGRPRGMRGGAWAAGVPGVHRGPAAEGARPRVAPPVADV